MNKNLKIFALGGLCEIGKNCYIIEKENDIIIVDCGIKFINDPNFINLADGIIPDFSYLLKNKEKIKALFITHGHEDHVGAISFLLDAIPFIPIYGSKFSISLLKQKIKDKKEIKLNIFEDDSIITTNEFKIFFFRVTHSIPGSFGLMIETNKDKTRIILTGDFKFDWSEIGEKTDLFKLADWGKKGIDLLLSDSTNAEIEGSTPSESKVIKVLENIILEAEKRVIITSFSSNVYRLKKVIDIAKKSKRKIVLLGSSLLKMMKIINNASLWKIENSIFLKSSLIEKTPKNKLIIFCTGSQGEEKAVLSRLAHQIYPGWKIEKGDSVILTSSPIMDNDAKIRLINNKLFSSGVEIYENSKGFHENYKERVLLHSSGHACKSDLKLMLTLVNPKYFMPFHGDFRMLNNHSFLAEEIGIPNDRIFVFKNGEILEEEIEKNEKKFLKSKEKIIIEPKYIFEKKTIDNKNLQNCIEIKKKMSDSGILMVVFYNKFKENVIEKPYIFTHGFINMKKNENLINEWKKIIKDFMIKNNELNLLEKFIEEKILKKWEKKPLIKIIYNK